MTSASKAAAPAWLGIAGPTASGKSDLALALAAQAEQAGLAVEIVSVDSAQVYRGLDLGTAKPTASERQAVPHHLIDILDPADAYDAGRFVRDAQQLIGAITARGALPLLVGGTMLYFHALMQGLSDLPPADVAIRQRLDREAAVHGWPALHARLAQVDPATAARLPPTDSQRIQRALEVFELTGQALSTFHQQGVAPGVPAQPGGLLVGLIPADRSWLHGRIAQRFDAMLNAGLLDEVAGLRARGDLHLGLPSMRCVGYRQAWEALGEDLAGKALHERVRERGIIATRQLAKRQLTWLRSTALDAAITTGDHGGSSAAQSQALWQRWLAAQQDAAA